MGVSTLSALSCFTTQDPVKSFCDGDTLFVGRDVWEIVRTTQGL